MRSKLGTSALLLFFFCPGCYRRIEGYDRSAIQNQAPVPAQYEDKSLFLSPIKQIRDNPSNLIVTGITVPHHLLARDLIAKAFHFASHGKYKQILVLSPDHFNLGDSDVSAAANDFSTVFGKLCADIGAVRKLEKLPFIRDQKFFYQEHGIQAELPFIKYYFPDAKIIALTFKATTPKDQLDQIVDSLKQLLGDNSFIVQSTDYSHYLAPDQAEIRDRQTIKALEKADPEDLLALNQPFNLDSKAAQYVQKRLQNEHYRSKWRILEHKNSKDYTKEKLISSTSYITQAYIAHKGLSNIEDGSVIYVGDIMLSRTIGPMMEKRNDYSFPFSKSGDLLSSASIKVGNLEGPISGRGVKSAKVYSFRSDPKVVAGLKKAGFNILSVANNHIWDYGKEAFVDTLTFLKGAGIDPVGGGNNYEEAHRGVLKDINGTKVVFLAYTELLHRRISAGKTSAGVSYLDVDQMVKDIKKAKERADIVMVSLHWGREYETRHSRRQEEMAKAAIDAGASLVVGHHPHVVQEIEEYKGGYIAYSLGNYVFDQNFTLATKTGLALKIALKDKKIFAVERYKIGFTSKYQPYPR